MKISYKVDKFVDYSGNTRQYVVVAVSDKVHTTVMDYTDEDITYTTNSLKAVFIGVSICHPEDEFNEEIGVKIAIGKALKNRSIGMYLTDAGLAQDTFINALVEQEVEHVKQDPGHYIMRYNEDKEKWQKEQNDKKFLDSLSSEENLVYNTIKNKSNWPKVDKILKLCGYIQ